MEEMMRREMMEKQAQAAIGGLAKSCEPPNIPEQLQSRREMLVQELQRLDRAIELMEKMPELAEALTLVRRIL